MPRRTTLNEDFFRQPSHDMFYVLGLAFADGNVHFAPSGKRWFSKFSLVSTDRTLLGEVADALDFNGTIGHRRWRGWKEHWKDQWQIQIVSKQLVQDLVEWGVVPRKSYKDIPFPHVPEEFLPSFVRGYFDGDGSIFSTGEARKHPIVHISGTWKFIEGLNEVLGLGHTYHYDGRASYELHVSKGSEVKAFHDFIYSTPGIRLDRKYQRFQELLIT